jgi:hypothetical protein
MPPEGGGVNVKQDGLCLNGALQLLMKRINGSKKDKLTGEWRKLRNEKLNYLYS